MAKSKQLDPVYKGSYNSLRVLCHLTAAVMFSYACYYDMRYVEFPVSAANMHSPFGGKFKYLTFLDAIIQAFFYIICLVNDFAGSYEVAPRRMLPPIRKFKDYIMAALAFPVALNVGVSFWSLYAIDRELVFPRILDAVFPSWLNHIMHTNIVVFIILEMFTSYHAYPTREKGLTGLTIFMLSYLVWIHIVKHYSGVWVYPVLEVLAFPQRILFFIAVLAFTLCMYFLGEFMNKTVWEKEIKAVQRKIKP